MVGWDLLRRIKFLSSSIQVILLLFGVIHCRYGSDYQPYLRSDLYKKPPQCFLAVKAFDKKVESLLKKKPPTRGFQIWDFEMQEGEVLEFNKHKGMDGLRDYEVSATSEFGYVELAYSINAKTGGNRTLSEGFVFKSQMEIEKAICH